MINSSNLPQNWAAVELKDIGVWGSGGTPTRTNKTYYNGEIPWLKIGDLTDSFVENAEVHITKEGLNSSAAKLLEPDTLLVAMYGSIGKLGITRIPCATNQAIAFCRPHPQVMTLKCLFFQLLFIRPKLVSLGQGGTQQNISQTILKQLSIGLPPLNEQHRIVEKIETLFARIDKGEEALREVRKLLKRYRQSILKVAVGGELTRDWREANKDKLEPASELLARILAIRRENWQGRGKYTEPPEPDTTNLPQLPDGWIWASFEQLFDVFGGATPSRRKPEYWGGDIPWVSSGEVAFGRIGSIRESITDLGYSSCSVRLHPPGTVLLAMIGEGKTRGQAAILDIAACNNQNVAAIRVSESGIPPEYVFYFLLGNYEKSRLEGQGGNQPALNGAKVKRMVLPLPPLLEMREVIDQVEGMFSTAEELESLCKNELTRSGTLRQSILKSAFTGNLVPQDPNDEPASELLARIRAEA